MHVLHITDCALTSSTPCKHRNFACGYRNHQASNQSNVQPAHFPSTASVALCARSIFATVLPRPDFSATRFSEPFCHVLWISSRRRTSPMSILVLRAASSFSSSSFCNRASYASACSVKESVRRWEVSAGAVRRKFASCSVWFSIWDDRDWILCASLVSKGSISVHIPQYGYFEQTLL